jgi:signal transduction histidine kinase
VRSYLDRRLPEGFRYELTGPFALYYDFVDEIQSSQVSSFASAAVGIFAVFVFFLWWTGSPPREALALGSLGMLPNVLPVVCTLGSMGLWGIRLDVGTAMVAAIVLGISTDDTVHVVSHFRDQRKLGLSDPEAMAVTIRQVGRAAISTGVALSLGFFALTLSSWQSIASFGLLSGIAILAALVAELFLLPSLVMGFGKEQPPAEEPAVSRGLARIGRQTLTWAAILVVGAVLAMMSTEQLRDREVARLSCWAFPNGYVPLGGALDRSCPLRPGDRLELLQAGGRIWRVSDPGEIDAALATPGEEVQARVVRRGETLWLSIPVLRESEATGALHLLAAGLTAVGTLGGVLLLLWYSSAAAAAPLAALYVCLIVMAVYLLTGLSHRVSPVPYLLAVGMAPAAAAHLALAFPHPRSLLVRVPGVARALYAAGALNAAILTYGYARYTELLAMGEWLTFSLGLGLLAAFLVGSLLPGSQAASALERERGRAAIVGALAVLFAAAVALAAFPRLLPGSVPWILAGAVLAIPVPIGFALARYQLNDLRPHMRQLAVGGLVRVLYVGGLAALLVAVAERSGDALHSEPVAVLGMFAGVVFVSALVGERAARAVGRLIPTVDARLRALERSHAARASELQSGEEAAQLAADTMAQGLAATGISIFVPAPLGWRLAVERGSGAVTEPALADRAAAMLVDEDSPLRFSIEGGGEGASANRLRALGVELVVPFRSRGDLTAVAFVCASEDGLPYTLPEIAFVRRVSARAATAIHNGRLAEDLLRAERFAAVGRVAAGLAHDVGKPMSVIHERARKMSDTEAYPHEVREDARSVASLADEALAAIDRLFMESRRGSAPAPTRNGLAEVVARAVLIASKLHAPERVEVRIEPDLPAVSHGVELTRVLTNLLDNALLAGPEGIVQLRVFRPDRRVCLEVVDRGCGMDDETLARAFEPFFTTRRSEGGRGIGLSASRALVEAMGGTLELESSPGEGTRARIWLVPEGPEC